MLKQDREAFGRYQGRRKSAQRRSIWAIRNRWLRAAVALALLPVIVLVHVAFFVCLLGIEIIEAVQRVALHEGRDLAVSLRLIGAAAIGRDQPRGPPRP